MVDFESCWNHWVKYPFGQPNPAEHGWLYELNQALFQALEKNLEPQVRVLTVSRPTFECRVGDEKKNVYVSTQRIRLPNSDFNSKVSYALTALTKLIRSQHGKTVMIYTPLVPCGTTDLDGGVNRTMMTIRVAILKDEATVDA